MADLTLAVHANFHFKLIKGKLTEVSAPGR